jgi:Asp-tRNA(Asn)/Glu-tRNA(Gln) amidotransferase A subunit family amidase
MNLFCAVHHTGYQRLYDEAVQRLEDLGGTAVPIDFEAFAHTASLLYTSAFLAERYSGVRSFLESGQVGAPAHGRLHCTLVPGKPHLSASSVMHCCCWRS